MTRKRCVGRTLLNLTLTEYYYFVWGLNGFKGHIWGRSGFNPIPESVVLSCFHFIFFPLPSNHELFLHRKKTYP